MVIRSSWEYGALKFVAEWQDHPADFNLPLTMNMRVGFLHNDLNPGLTLDDSVNAPARIWETIANVVFPSTDVVADLADMQTHLPYMEAGV